MTALVAETQRKASPRPYSHGPTDAERNFVRRRRSLYIAEDLQEGDVLTPSNLRRIRPGLGLPPKHFDVLIGKKINQAVTKGTPMSWDLVS